MSKRTTTLSFFPEPGASIQTVAHRGGSLEAPENTLYALSQSFQKGLMAEVDVGLSRDGKPMILHDETLLRTTGSEGLLEDFLEVELSTLRADTPGFGQDTLKAMAAAGIHQAPSFALGQHVPGLHVPSLQNALALPKGRFMLELKASRTPEVLLKAVLVEVDRAHARDRVAFASFDPRLLELAERHAPDVPRIGVAESMEEARDMLRRPIACLAVSCEIAQEIRAATPPTIALWVWTVYTAAQAERMRVLGVDGVITDAPKEVSEAMVVGKLPELAKL